jgi:hypothetical protein
MDKYHYALIFVICLLLGFNYLDNTPTSSLTEFDNNSIVFVWNDTEESIPVDGTPVMLEFTDENTVYIGPIE